MRCPKCHYLSFDPEPRCRNCGYDLEVADPDLALRADGAGPTPLPDLTLREPAPAPAERITLEMARPASPLDAPAELRLSLVDEPGEGPATAIVAETAETRAIEPPVVSPPAVATAAEPRRSPFRAPHTTAELPLFVKSVADRADFRTTRTTPCGRQRPYPRRGRPWPFGGRRPSSYARVQTRRAGDWGRWTTTCSKT